VLDNYSNYLKIRETEKKREVLFVYGNNLPFLKQDVADQNSLNKSLGET